MTIGQRKAFSNEQNLMVKSALRPRYLFLVVLFYQFNHIMCYGK